MTCVYLLESLRVPGKRYIGRTNDAEKRLAEHNAERSPYTKKFAPWRLSVAVHFADEGRARAFEAYLKSGSGHAFARRHFWPLQDVST
jgi:predicted GIY-YIG superfamily endonuclease